jgi:uncharacterized protein (DUF983 family)
MSFKRCPDCGFGADESQFQKTKDKCPRCNPNDAKEHARKAKGFE